MGASPPALVADLVERCGPSERPQGHIAGHRKFFLSLDYKEEQLTKVNTPHDDEEAWAASTPIPRGGPDD